MTHVGDPAYLVDPHLSGHRQVRQQAATVRTAAPELEMFPDMIWIVAHMAATGNPDP